MEKKEAGNSFGRIPKIRTSLQEKFLMAVSLFFLVGGFLGVVGWFSKADIYYAHFFQNGYSIFAYNIFRMFFALFLTWIIYAVGYAVISLTVSVRTRHEFTLAERIVLGFGTGAGIWHVLLLILGVSNLYYRSVMIWLCVAVLCASANHFKQVVSEIGQEIKRQVVEWREGVPLKGIVTLLLGMTLVWLLMVRGLYPGGGGDYYTHYFYYYTEVIRNHGLAPNDVWYHYYYSKGAGLYFLGMLLTDPEAPQVVTFCFVAVATLALTSLSARVAPRSLWPAFCALLYILYNLVPLANGGGEFQKIHEETTALVVMMIWAICMYGLRPKQWERPTTIMMAAIVVGSAILTQAIAVFFGVVLGILAFVALMKKNFRVMWHYGLLAALAGCAVVSIFVLNYLVTGLATDQAIHLTWRFANLERLHQWGVIPNVIIVAWIRENYQTLVVPWGLGSLRQLSTFMRLDQLWVVFFATIIPLLLTFRSLLRKSAQMKVTRKKLINSDESSSISYSVLVNVMIVLCAFAVLSVFAGRSQSVSFYRFSSFFVPLLMLFSVAAWGLFINVRKAQYPLDWVLRMDMPLILIAAVIFSWSNWSSQVKAATKSAIRFTTGRYSLAEAYSHQTQGFSFGGINPGAYEAVRHAPPGARIWSTNVDSYCMVPGCKIESVVSFKLSSQLSEILSASPEEAKKKLQSEGLNYFIYSTESRLLDILPYSHLFDPSTINKYFAIKWTDGKTYLLTWKVSNTTPLGRSFLDSYSKHINEPESTWFRFSEGVPFMNDKMRQLVSAPHPWKPVDISPPVVQDNVINIIEATYGNSCRNAKVPSQYLNMAHIGNVTSTVKNICGNKLTCNFAVSQKIFGDPANGCAKDFNVIYSCPSRPTVRMNAFAPKEAEGRTVRIDCKPSSGINVVSATLGGNCWLKFKPWFFYGVQAGNATSFVRHACHGKVSCSFVVNAKELGNPAKKCKKDFRVSYYCPSRTKINEAIVKGEALEKTVILNC